VRNQNRTRTLKAQLSLSALIVLGSVFLFGCPSKEDPKDTPTPQPSASAATSATAEVPAVKPSTSLVVESAVPGIAARVKGEVDSKDPDAGARGSTIVAGKATFAAPTGWKAGKSGIWSTATAADNKSAVTAGNFAATETANAKLTEAATALGYSDCQWAPPETVTVGKDKLAGVAGDGKCKQGGASVTAAYVAFDSMKVLAMGGWADGSDATGVFSTFRHAKGVAGGGGDSTGISACCSALAQNAGSAPPNQKGSYLAAAAACRALVANPQGRALLGSVRAMLAGGTVPPTCR
jgi:hypothetical protein